MSRKSRSPAWPFLTILGCLFVLSITAPRAWQRIAHRKAERSEAPRFVPEPQVAAEAAPAEVAGSSPVPAEPAADTDHDRSVPTDADLYARSVEVPPADDVPRAAVSAPAALDNVPLPVADSEPIPVVDNTPIPVVAGTPPAAAEPSPAVEPLPATVPAAPAFGMQAPAQEPLLVVSRPLPLKTDLEEALVPPPPVSPDPRAAAERIDAARWAVPTTLLDQLASLCQCQACLTWVEDVRNQLRDLGDIASDSRALADGLKDLEELVRRGQGLAAQIADPVAQSQFLRAQYSLERRLAVWQELVGREEIATDGVASADEHVRHRVAELQTLMASSEAGAGWREYLLLDRLNDAAGRDLDAEARRQLARLVLDRLNRAQHSRQQRVFASEGPLALLGNELQNWAAESVPSTRIVSRIEAYERTGLGADARQLATDCRALSWSQLEGDRRLAAAIDSYYRGANVRLAVAGSLLNRLLPQPPATYMPISDTLIGIPVRGHSTAWTQLHLQLVPDPRRVRLGLEATGVVESDTTSSSGPATFYNNGRSTFLVQKLYVLGPKGLRNWPAISGAKTGSNQVTMSTEFDGIPLFGGLVRSIARSQFQESEAEALGEAEVKLANRVRLQFDSVANARMQEAQSDFDKRVWRRMHEMGVELTPVSFNTTEDRVSVRLRLADGEQLGAHTPRPRAPSDSLVSLQIHQTVINNMLERLELAGHRFTLPLLFGWISKKLDLPEPKLSDDLPDDVFITFAPRDALNVQLKNQRVELAIRVAELTQGRNHWRNFTVRASYRAEQHGLQACFQRDGGIRLEGETIKGKPELVLRGIFSRALSASRQVPLLPEAFVSDARVKDLIITQFIADDGWLGLACASSNRGEFEARRATTKRR